MTMPESQQKVTSLTYFPQPGDLEAAHLRPVQSFEEAPNAQTSEPVTSQPLPTVAVAQPVRILTPCLCLYTCTGSGSLKCVLGGRFTSPPCQLSSMTCFRNTGRKLDGSVGGGFI